MTDWNLVIQSNISLLWLNECMKKSNQNKKVEDLMKEFQARNENVGILNSGTLMMASYFLFLYPREQEGFDVCQNIDISKFQIIEKGIANKDESQEQYIVRRIRNSLAHGNFIVDNNIIIFADNNKTNTNKFNVNIPFIDFGKFINEFFFKSKEYSLNEK
ncbi:MAG: hypothetical protein QMB51_02470 [Patescibacteria group bacterium]